MRSYGELHPFRLGYALEGGRNAQLRRLIRRAVDDQGRLPDFVKTGVDVEVFLVTGAVELRRAMTVTKFVKTVAGQWYGNSQG